MSIWFVEAVAAPGILFVVKASAVLAVSAESTGSGSGEALLPAGTRCGRARSPRWWCCPLLSRSCRRGPYRSPLRCQRRHRTPSGQLATRTLGSPHARHHPRVSLLRPSCRPAKEVASRARQSRSLCMRSACSHFYSPGPCIDGEFADSSASRPLSTEPTGCSCSRIAGARWVCRGPYVSCDRATRMCPWPSARVNPRL